MKRPDLATLAAGAAVAVGLTANLTEDRLIILFLICVAGIGLIYVLEIFRMIK